jgi:hypothetical protein
MNLKEIKDAARQAFRDQQLQDTEGGVPDAVSFCAGFLAGARHRQAEIDELTSVLDLKKETLVELEAENKKLREALEQIAYHVGKFPIHESYCELSHIAREALKEIKE